MRCAEARNFSWIVAAATSLLLFGCASTPYPGPSGEEGYALSQDANRSVTIGDAKFNQDEVAMVSLWSPGAGPYILKIDGINTNVLRLNTPAPVWLKPGTHEFYIAWHGLRTTTAFRTTSETLVANHIYLPRILLLDEKRETVVFRLIDHGTKFPRDCLPVALQKANNFDFSRKLFQECLNRRLYSDPAPLEWIQK